MTEIQTTLRQFLQREIDKPTFIQSMYERHHSALFDYAHYIDKTNIKKIEIENGLVIMTSRDRGVRIACFPGDFRIAPIETLNFFDYEKDESAMLENLISDGDSVFDIGANIGWYSINIATSKRAVKVYAFEPIPKSFRQLQVNVALNSVPNAIIHNFGFSNQRGELVFYFYPEGSVNASLENVSGRSDVETVRCQVRTLDDYTHETGARVDVIKCDVEGAELLVFEGAKETIARDKPIVFSEILRKWSAKFNYDPNKIFDLFLQQNYRSFTVKGQWLIEFERMNDATVETNFFFLHAEKHNDLIRRYAVAR